MTAKTAVRRPQIGPLEAELELKALWRQLGELHQQAGLVGNQALRGPPPWDPTQTREAYFSVADIELRKRLIGLYRKAEEANRNCRNVALDAARSDASRAQRYRAPWAAPAVFISVSFVFCGYAVGQLWETRSGGLPGAISGAVIGLIYAMNARDEANEGRQRAMTEAAKLLAEEERRYSDYLAQLVVWDLFTEAEERSGEPGGF